MYEARFVKRLKNGGWFVFRNDLEHAGPFPSETAARAWVAAKR